MTCEKKGASLDWLALWILFSAWSSLSGWGLSVGGYLNPAGIAISYSLFALGLFFCRSHLCVKGGWNGCRVLHSRFLVPGIWLVLVILAFAGGMTHAPNNYDYLTYRFPRVLYWSWDHGWSWISTVNLRINYSAPGFEWLMAPLFILFKTDRLFFLLNFIPYLLLPGVVFSVFTRLGISKRISWWWMWILPGGYCYILQAASTGNDSFAALYFLASLHYLLRIETASSVKNLTLSCLAIALMTGAKASNLPLVLPWLVLLFSQRKNFLGEIRPAAITGIFIVSAAVSFFPMALLNIHFTGDYAGDPDNDGKLKVNNPVFGVLGNSLQMAKDNLAPPFSSRSIDWESLLPAHLKARLRRDFPRLDLRSGELQIEEGAGLGLGIVLFASLFAGAGIWARVAAPVLIVARNNQAMGVVCAGVVAWLAYMSKMGSEATSRLLAAYYPLLIAGILVAISLDGRIVRRLVFKWIGCLALASAIPLVILCPARPLFPVHAVSNFMVACHVPEAILTRYNQVYSVYSARADAFRELVASIPPEEKAIGFLQGGDVSEVSLWRPFGTRKVVEVTPEESMEKLKTQGIHFLVVSQDALAERYHTTVAALAATREVSLVVEKNIMLKARRGPETWYLLRTY